MQEKKKKIHSCFFHKESSLGVLDRGRSGFQVQKYAPTCMQRRRRCYQKPFEYQNETERLKLLPARGDEAAEQDAKLQREILIINPSHYRPELFTSKVSENQNYSRIGSCQKCNIMK